MSEPTSKFVSANQQAWAIIESLYPECIKFITTPQVPDLKWVMFSGGDELARKIVKAIDDRRAEDEPILPITDAELAELDAEWERLGGLPEAGISPERDARQREALRALLELTFPAHLITEEELFGMCEAMRQDGGGFVKCLAECFARADPANLFKLLNTFPAYVKKYRAMAEAGKGKTA